MANTAGTNSGCPAAVSVPAITICEVSCPTPAANREPIFWSLLGSSAKLSAKYLSEASLSIKSANGFANPSTTLEVLSQAHPVLLDCAAACLIKALVLSLISKLKSVVSEGLTSDDCFVASCFH